MTEWLINYLETLIAIGSTGVLVLFLGCIVFIICGGWKVLCDDFWK